MELPSSVDAADSQLPDEPFEILDVVLDQVRALGTPARIAVAAHVDGEHVVVAGEVDGDVVEGVGVLRDAVQQNQRRLRGRAPLEVVEPQPVHRHGSIGVGRGGLRGLCGRERRQERKGQRRRRREHLA